MWTDPIILFPIYNICQMYFSIEKSATNTHIHSLFLAQFLDTDFLLFVVSLSFYNSSSLVLQVIWYYLYFSGVQHYLC